MAVNIYKSKPSRGHSKALSKIDLNVPGRLYIGHLMAYYNVAHSTVYTHIRKKLIPEPDGRVGKRPYWHPGTIRQDLEK